MKQKLKAFLIMLILVVFSQSAFTDVTRLVIKNVKVLDPIEGVVGVGLVVDGQHVSHIIAAANQTPECSVPCREIDGQGGFLIPGFHDAHAHSISGGAGHFRARVSGSSVSSIQSSLRSYISTRPNETVIFGRGFDLTGFSQSRLPNKADLDAVSTTVAILLLDVDGHSVWANSRAIEMSKIDKNTPDPAGGKIVRLSDGSPSGLFLETAADLVWSAMPETAKEVVKEYILKGQQVTLAAGFTSLNGGDVSLRTAEIYRELDLENKLKQRNFLWLSLGLDDEKFENAVAFANSLPHNSKVKITAFKGFVDGVVSAYTAALLQPYSDNPAELGTPTYTQEELNRLVLRANQAGFPAALHVIGDRAVRMALDAFEASYKVTGKKLLNRLEHIELIDPSDVKRIYDLGVVASMQPTHFRFVSNSASYYPSRLGPERIQHAFAWREISDAGALMVFGTDYPVISSSATQALESATQRRHYDGSEFEPQQRVSGDLAFKALTVNPAVAIKLENQLGRIQVGHLADLTIVSGDPRSETATVSVQKTIFNGELQ